ncbi:hypothetical protein NKJ88_05830 [Mesorhizobium sp. M0016]|uniref:hypothetical protein n=1 Tax=Mesorhizobium sp. M0016 TaxID=2956843 RepID=UPI0033398993
MRKAVIWNLTQRKYVARPGSEKSFTGDIRKAQQFPSKAVAEADCCGNEKVEMWNGLERFS